MRHYELTESLTTPYNFDTFHSNVTFGGKSKLSGKEGMTATFFTKDGNEYKIHAYKLGMTKAQRDRMKDDMERGADDEFWIPEFGDFGGIWEVHFSMVAGIEGTAKKYTNKITGSGDALRVFATIMQFLKKLRAEKDPDIVSIKSKAEEGNRTNLYTRMAKRFAPQMGYQIHNVKTIGDKIRLELRKT